MPQTLEDRMNSQGVPDFAAEDAKKFAISEQEKQDWAKADGVAKVLAETPDIGLGEQAAAAKTPPELRPLVADALRKKLAETKANEKIGGGMRLGLSLARGMVGVGAPRARMVGLMPKLDPEQERFADELTQIRASEDPLQQPGGGITGFLGRQVQSTAEQVMPMLDMVGAGAQGGLALSAASKVLGLGKAASALATGAGARLGVTAAGLPQIADETYRELIVEGHDPNRAWWTTAVSAPIESAIESFLPDPFKAAPGVFKGTIRQVVGKLTAEFLKRYGPELGEEALQGITRESGKEIARAIDEKIPNKGFGEILKKGWESVQQAAVPMFLMLSPTSVKVAGGAAIDVAQRGAAMKKAQAERPALQERRTERQAMEQRFKEREDAALNVPYAPQRSIPADVATELQAQRQGNTYAPGVQAKLDDLRAKRAKGWISKDDVEELGLELTPEQMESRKTRTKAVDDLIEKAKEEAVPVEAPAPVKPVAKSISGTHVSSNLDSISGGFVERDPQLGVSIARSTTEEQTSPTSGEAQGRFGRAKVTVKGNGLDYKNPEHRAYIDGLLEQDSRNVVPNLRKAGIDFVENWNSVGEAEELHVVNPKAIQVDSVAEMDRKQWQKEKRAAESPTPKATPTPVPAATPEVTPAKVEVAKEPWEMSRAEHESSAEKKGDSKWDAFKAGGVTVVKNPKSSDLRDMTKEFRDKFPSAPADSVKVRSTFDAEGNKYSWMSDATHADIEPEINKRYGTTTNQNKVEGVPHRYVVAEAIASGKRVPTEVLREYKESLPGMLSAAREKSGEGSVHPDVVADFIEITGTKASPAPKIGRKPKRPPVKSVEEAVQRVVDIPKPPGDAEQKQGSPPKSAIRQAMEAARKPKAGTKAKPKAEKPPKSKGKTKQVVAAAPEAPKVETKSPTLNRRTPAKGTSMRERMDAEYDKANAVFQNAADEVDELKRQHDAAKYGTKKRDALAKKLEKARGVMESARANTDTATRNIAVGEDMVDNAKDEAQRILAIDSLNDRYRDAGMSDDNGKPLRVPNVESPWRRVVELGRQIAKDLGASDEVAQQISSDAYPTMQTSYWNQTLKQLIARRLEIYNEEDAFRNAKEELKSLDLLDDETRSRLERDLDSFRLDPARIAGYMETARTKNEAAKKEQKTRKGVEKTAAKDNADALKPLVTKGSSVDSAWSGTSVDANGRYLSDGRIILDSNMLGKADVATLRRKEKTVAGGKARILSASAAEELWNSVTKDSGSDATFLGVVAGREGGTALFEVGGKLYPYDADRVAYLTRIMAPDEYRIPTNKGNAEHGLLGMKKGQPVFFVMALSPDMAKMPMDIDRAKARGLKIGEQPTRQPSARTKAKAEAVEQAKKEFRDAAKTQLGGSLPGVPNLKLAAQAWKLLGAVADHKFSQFRDFIDHLVKLVGEKKVLQLGEYLQEGWNVLRDENPNMDEPSSVKDMLRKPVKKAKPTPKAEKPAPKSKWQDYVPAIVTKEVTIPDLFQQLQAKHPDMTLAEFKQGMLDMAKAKTIILKEHTRAEAEIAGQEAAIRVKPSRFLPNGALFYFARPGTEKATSKPVAPPVKAVEPTPEDVGEKVGKGGDTTGTKNAKTDEMRAKLGLPERPPVQPQTFEEWEAEGARRLAANPDYARDLAEELVANPRAVDPGDNAALGQYTTQLQNRIDAGEDVKSEMAMVIQAAELVGTEASHALASRKAERYPDLSLATFIKKHVQDIGKQPSKEQLDKYAALADEIAALKAENQNLREADAKAEIEKRILEAKLTAKPKAAPKEKVGTKKERLQKQASEAVASFKSAWNEAVKAAGGAFTASGVPLNPEAIAAAGRAAKAAAGVVKAYAELGVTSFMEFISRVKVDVGPLDADQEKLFRDEWDKAVKAGEIARPVNSASKKPAIGVMAKTLTRWAVESGITETEAVIDAVHAELLSMGVNQTRSDTMDAMSGYGEFKELPHDPVSDIVRGIKGEIRAQRQLKDYQQGRAALRSGVERPEPTEAERQLRKDVNEAKKLDGIVSRDPSKELKSALDTAKTAVENAMVDTELAIEALEKAIAEKTPLTKADPAPGPVDDALKAMREKLAEKRAKRKELRAEYDKLFPPKRGALTDAKRLAMAEALLKRLNEEMVAEIQSLRDGTWVPEVQKSPLTSSTLTRLQAANDALKAALKAAKEGSPAYQAELQAKEDAQYLKSQKKRLAFWEKVETEARLGILPKAKPKKVRSNPQILTNDIAIKKKKDAALYEMEMEKRRQWNLGQWIFAGLNDAASLLPRALMLGLEASPLTRQGRMYLGSPSKVFPNLVRSIASVFSERMAFSQNENLRNRANYKSGEYEAAGVDFTDSSGTSSKMEEIYQSAILRWLSKTEGVYWIPLRWPAKAYMASERGVQNFLNGMRADIYDTGKMRTQRIRKFFDKHGIPTETEWSKNDIKNWGRAANIFSGRGTGIRGNAATNFFVLAARWTWSTLQTEFQVPFQMATPKFIGQWNADAATRIAHAQLYAQAVLAGATHLAAVYWLMMLLADDDDETDDKPTIETDWTSTDLWKVRVGDTTIDTLGGMQQPFVFANRIIQGVKKTRSGEVVPLRGEGSSPYKGDAWTEFTNQLLYKSGPAFSGIVEFWRQKTALGDELPDNKLKRAAVIAGKRMVPITYPDMVQVEKNLGWKQGTVAALEAFIGSSVGTYGDRTDFREGTPEERTEQFEKDLEKLKWDSPAPAYSDLLTHDQVKQVESRRDVVRGNLIMDALAQSPDERVAEFAKKKKAAYKDEKALQEAQEAFRKNQESFAALKAQVSLDDAEKLLAAHYIETAPIKLDKDKKPIPKPEPSRDGDGSWKPFGLKSENQHFYVRRNALRKAYQGK